MDLPTAMKMITLRKAALEEEIKNIDFHLKKIENRQKFLEIMSSEEMRSMVMEGFEEEDLGDFSVEDMMKQYDLMLEEFRIYKPVLGNVPEDVDEGSE